MSTRNLELGKSGEEEAVKFLRQKGYKILKRNYKSKLGEVDIIAKEKGFICFVEVKTRTALDMGSPTEAITKNKQHRISKAALGYLKENKLFDCPSRFDVVSVLKNDFQNQIELIQNAFDLESKYAY